MALARAVQGAKHTAQRITWEDEDGDAQVLTGATITGKKLSVASGVSSAIDGTLAVIDGAAGIFSWTYGTNDVTTAGEYRVQFTASFAGPLLDRTFLTTWIVEPAI